MAVQKGDGPNEMYAKVGGVVRWSGGTTVLKAGQSIEEDHPLVEERSDLFTYEGPGASIRGNEKPRVERATQAPGETRQVRIPQKRAPKKGASGDE